MDDPRAGAAGRTGAWRDDAARLSDCTRRPQRRTRAGWRIHIRWKTHQHSLGAHQLPAAGASTGSLTEPTGHPPASLAQRGSRGVRRWRQERGRPSADPLNPWTPTSAPRLWVCDSAPRDGRGQSCWEHALAGQRHPVLASCGLGSSPHCGISWSRSAASNTAHVLPSWADMP